MAGGNKMFLQMFITTVITWRNLFHLAQLHFFSPTQPTVPNSAGQTCKHASTTETEFKECGNTGLPNLQCRAGCAFMWEHTCAEQCARGFLAKSLLKSLEGVLAICSNSVYSWPDDQMNQDRDCCCGPVQPSQAGLLQQSHRHYRPLNAPLNTPLHPQLNSPLEP